MTTKNNLRKNMKKRLKKEETQKQPFDPINKSATNNDMLIL
jgi:hypothetical protein